MFVFYDVKTIKSLILFLSLINEQRIDFVTVANYSEDSTLTKTIKLYIESMAVMANLKEKEEKQLAMYLKASEEER